MMETTDAPGTVDCVYETTAIARCPHGEGAIFYDVEIHISPTGETIELESFDTWLEGLYDMELTQEELADTIGQRLDSILECRIRVITEGEHAGIQSTVTYQ